jgi:hypothetical protein
LNRSEHIFISESVLSGIVIYSELWGGSYDHRSALSNERWMRGFTTMRLWHEGFRLPSFLGGKIEMSVTDMSEFWTVYIVFCELVGFVLDLVCTRFFGGVGFGTVEGAFLF